jgi:hypothetical protein
LAADTADLGLLSEPRVGAVNVIFRNVGNMDDPLAAANSS